MTDAQPSSLFADFCPGWQFYLADGCASLISLGAPYNQNFDTLATSGTANATSTLPVGWNLTETGGGTRDNEQYGADDGGSNTGDTYSYGATGNNERAFGGLRSGTLVPVMGVCFTNNTGVAINSFKVVYVGEMWRLGTAERTDQLDFEYSTNATSLTTGIWIAANDLDFLTPTTSGSAGAGDGNTPANRAVPNATITGLSIANGANFWLRWTDLDASGSDDGLAIDNFSLIPLAVTATLTATKTDALATDADTDSQADPGDVLSYTVVISSGGATATGLTLSDTLDANTDLLGSASVSPVAFDNTYNASTNPASLTVPDGPADLFANDYLGQNPPVSGISSFGGGSLPGDAGANAAGSTVTLNTGGSLMVNASGSFNFTPPAGFQGVFGFFYRLQNSIGPSDGLVTITVDAPPTVTTTSPANAATNVNGASNITINFSENVNIAAGGITIDCGAGAIGFTPALPQNGVSSLVLDPTTNLPGNATCTVTILAANTTDSDANDPPNQLDGNNDGSEGDNYSFSFQVAPTANDDSFAVTPHLTLNSSGTTTVTVRANDDPTSVTITGFGATLGTANSTAPDGTNSITTGLGGTVILNADGTFTYNPPPDQRSVNDAFFYTITGGDTATVTLAIQNQALIWFVDAGAAAGGNGTQTRPFNLLTGAGSFDAVASDNTGDFIFIADGSYTCGLTLLNNQTVLGDGSSSSLQAISGVTPVSGSSLPAFSGTDPTLSNAAGDCLTLGSGNTLRGLTIGNTSATGSDITGANFGTLTVTETTLNGTGRALNLNNGTFNATLDGLTSTSGVNNVNLVSVNGIANLGSGALSGASSDAFVVNGGNVSVTYNGNVSQASNAALVSVSGGHSGGTLTFQTGTLNASSGTGLQFSNADGVYNFNGTTTLNGGDAGVDITNGSGGTFSFSTNASINNPSGIAYREDTSTASVTYNGTITKNNNANQAVDINAKTGGATAFNGAIVASTTTATAIDLTNTGGVVNFTGGLNLTTSSGVGFNATGAGATVTATQNNSTIINTINSTTGTALNVVNTTIGGSGLTFRSISANGGSNTGIILDTTGSSGGLTISGTGSAGSGGTIASKTGSDGSTTTGIGIYLNSTRNVSLNWMQLNDFQNFAIRGSSVVNFTLDNTTINGTNGNNDGADEASVRFTELTGSANVTNCNISGGVEDNFTVVNTGGTLNRITFTNTTFGANSTASGSDGILIEGQNNAVVNTTVQNGFFTSTRGDHFQLNLIATASADLVFTGNNISNVHPAVVSGGGGIRLTGGSTASNVTATYNISNNIMRDSNGTAIGVTKGAGAGTFTGTIDNNQIGVAGVANSGSSGGSGISVITAESGTHSVVVTNNQIRQYNNFGIIVQAGGLPTVGTGNLKATVTGNTISNPGTTIFAKNGFQLNSGTVPGDAFQVCLTFGGAGVLRNSLVGTGTDGGTDFRLRQRQSTTVRLPGYGGANNDDVAVVTFAQGNNNLGGTPTGSATNTVPTGGGWLGSACPF